MVGIGVDVFGDFRVCPFTPARPGKMQTVCVDTAEHVTAQSTGIPTRK